MRAAAIVVATLAVALWLTAWGLSEVPAPLPGGETSSVSVGDSFAFDRSYVDYWFRNAYVEVRGETAEVRGAPGEDSGSSVTPSDLLDPGTYLHRTPPIRIPVWTLGVLSVLLLGSAGILYLRDVRA